MNIQMTNAVGAAVLIFITVFAYSSVYAGNGSDVATIQVSATGSAQLAPDMAILSLSVVREGASAREALDANNSAMGGVITALSDIGIEKKDLQTSSFNIQPRYKSHKNSSGNNRGPQIIGYSVSNSLTVRIRDLSELGVLLDLVVTLGVNSGGNVRFTNDDPSDAISKARARAMKNAIAKATTLADAAGVQLGGILLISENAGRLGPVPVAMARASFRAAADGVVPVASGENSYSVTVNVNWKIKQ